MKLLKGFFHFFSIFKTNFGQIFTWLYIDFLGHNLLKPEEKHQQYQNNTASKNSKNNKSTDLDHKKSFQYLLWLNPSSNIRWKLNSASKQKTNNTHIFLWCSISQYIHQRLHITFHSIFLPFLRSIVWSATNKLYIKKKWVLS